MKKKHLIGLGLIGGIAAFYYLKRSRRSLTVIKKRMGTKPEMGNVFDVVDKTTGKIKEVIFEKAGVKTTVKVKPLKKRYGGENPKRVGGETKMDYWHRVLLEDPTRMIPAWYRRIFPKRTKALGR